MKRDHIDTGDEISTLPPNQRRALLMLDAAEAAGGVPPPPRVGGRFAPGER